MNTTVTYSDARDNLKGIFDKVCNECQPILVERRMGDNVVIISEEDYRSLEETAYLLKSPKNAKRLFEALYRPKSERIFFNNTNDLKNALGL